jgi:hypothetical protein
MAISTDFNYDNILSLDKAKLMNRVRLNFLGSQELILDYNGVSSTAREDCVEYLEANRLSVVNPSFGFKTYEGTWYCVDITYNEDKKTIRQRFKIDSSLLNDVTKRTSAGTLAEKSYYWKIVDPDSIELPAAGSIPDGTTYSKTSNDNGDGTFDVVVSKDISVDFGGGGSAKQWAENETQSSSPSTSIFVSGSNMNNAAAAQEYEHTFGTIGETDAIWTGVTDNTWRIKYDTTTTPDVWFIESGGTKEANHPYIGINSSEWYDTNKTASTADYREDLVVQIGRNPPATSESTTVSTNSNELSFVSEGGTVPDPIEGQNRTISNSSLGNGKFQTTITTVTSNPQRIPALVDSIVFAGQSRDQNAVIVGKNATYEQFQLDLNILHKQKLGLQNTFSANINRFGLYDYTIRATEI